MRHAIILLFIIIGTILKAQEPLRYLALGDSYTIGQGVSETERWPYQLVDSLQKLDLENDTLAYIATTGWRTDNLQNAIRNSNLDSNFNLVSLLIGVNNQYQGRSFDQYKKEFPELLSTAVALASGDKSNVFVVSIPDYAFTPFGRQNENISIQLDRYNAFADSVCQVEEIPFVNITPISRRGIDEPGLVAFDGLHPSGAQYKLWIDLIVPLFVEETVLTSINNTEEMMIEIREGVIRGDFPFEIYSLEGRLLTESQTDFELKSLPQGYYIIKSNNKTLKFFKY